MDTRQCKSKRSKLDEIHRNSYEIRTKFVRFHISRKFTQIYSREICTNFVRFSREFRPICQYTRQTHKQAHLAVAWAGDAPCPGPRALGRPPRWDRVHQVPQRGRPTRGGNAGQGEVGLRLRVDIAPLGDLQLVHAAHEEQHALGADLNDGEVGGRGRPGDEGGVEGAGGGACRERLGGSAKRAWAASPSHNPTLPTAPFPTHNTWSTLGRSQLDKSPATSRASLGGMASKCVVLAWWCLCPGSGVHKLKRAPCNPSLESGWAGNP